jgi:hypothetical protein
MHEKCVHIQGVGQPCSSEEEKTTTEICRHKSLEAHIIPTIILIRYKKVPQAINGG